MLEVWTLLKGARVSTNETRLHSKEKGSFFIETAKPFSAFVTQLHRGWPTWQRSRERSEESRRSAAALDSHICPPKEAMTLAQEYIKEHGPAPKELLEDDGVGVLPAIDAIVHWSGKGKLAPYRALEPKLTQKYRLYGEKCVVIGCKRTVDAPKYIMVRHSWSIIRMSSKQ